MSRLVSNIAFSFLLLFHSAAMAEEETSPTEPYAEEQEAPEITEDAQPESGSDAGREKIEASEPEDALSEAEKEALEAEAAELRESGIYDEPIEE
ncbi:MAG TPA: hypothetical protein VIM88_07995 [Sulfurovum sp.]|uniref:hypothetical protein n=1 Tax=Sulfurovum sp. TaxID=1969726 RepID=UPI002F92A92F